MSSRAIVLLKTNDLGTGEIVLETQYVAYFGAAPAIYRLIVVADTADILVLLGQQAKPQVLGDVGVLVFVDQQVAEALLVYRHHFWVDREKDDVVEQQLSEVAVVQADQAFLICPEEMDHAPTRRV